MSMRDATDKEIAAHRERVNRIYDGVLNAIEVLEFFKDATPEARLKAYRDALGVLNGISKMIPQRKPKW